MTNQIDIFVPCFIDQFFPETAFNMIKILEKHGMEINYNPNQTCCGQMAFANGFWDEARVLGEKFLKDFPNNRYVVGGSATCISFIKNYYGKLFHNTAYHLEFRQLQRNIFEFTDFMVNVLRINDIGSTFNHKVTYHDSCVALREYGIKDEPRLLLQYVKGLELIEMKDTDICCGFGGSFSVKNETISVLMAEKKLNNALATGAEFIVSTDVSCLIQMNAIIQKQNLPIKCIHIIDLLASGL